ncbi:MAG: adenosylmethionine--8-amino-7-oxononanoate transaminase [Planctomycetes bacterium]|nr:adenosylmethionine--8-amino-7-oxononanoate transaminase [Planctomycetota bacterium]MCP4769924.1 adenosylmethionine--8-amino-7-oxononanoate transaminase [Planctomycetota bacterium]MCP4859764.1 adenosylmethionine--8-amino-7-oxononanoate transaminase [Planctomycetota bacterium]
MSPSLPERDREVCWHPYTQHALDTEPLPVVGAKGAWLELADGTKRLDAIASWWANLHGHGRPEFVEAMRDQAQQLDHIMFAGFTHEPGVALAEQVLEIAPDSLTKVFYSDNGSTAVEVALKAAYQTWVRRGEPARTVFLALNGAYHGDTFGAMAVGEPEPFFAEFSPFLFHVVHVEPTAESLREALDDLEGRVAGFILEPLVQGAAGMCMHSVQFLQDARRICNERNIFLIADEVMTGFGRTGKVFACDHAGISPDLMCLAKGLTGGIFPLSATLVSEEIYQAFLDDERAKAFFHGHTFSGHPIGCAVGLASLKVLKEENTPALLDHIGQRIEKGLQAALTWGGVKEIRRCGGIVALELDLNNITGDDNSGEEGADEGGYLAPVGERLRQACRENQQVLLRPLGHIMYAMPPSCVTDEECDLIASAILGVVQSVLE